MLIVAIAWIYVVGMAAIAEALSPQGTVLGAMVTFVFYGVLPLAVVLYLIGTPGRKKARRRAEAHLQGAQGGAPGAASETPVSALPIESALDATGLQPDGGGHAPGGTPRLAAPVAPEREVP